ncbi:hypothetical protein [Cellulophaga sp. Hel_I_12]|uniref:hypothetical protein n=1 Tax=Cellulophaga sp. Hel_I_12 TaxID=1249972 RepID=UPI000645AFA8|nr:hypothetical protein [Cellulophaga sp. Hel_I_12]
MKPKILFSEQQKFTQWWLWLLLIAPIVIIAYTLIPPTIDVPNPKNSSFHLDPSNDIWISLVIMLLVLLLFLVMRLNTTIDQVAITVRFFPFFKKSWEWSEIQSANVVTYRFVGYGIRISGSYGMVYNVKGNKGLAIRLKNGQKYLVGTQNPEAMQQILNKITT